MLRYMVWHVDKYKIVYELLISYWGQRVLCIILGTDYVMRKHPVVFISSSENENNIEFDLSCCRL
jgi:hypothetical protein